ncbi:MAG TPA: hypothetical protein DCZ94_18380 [Lentisphaeria bacterium]|nr:MAG: hypothetical protein A2X48_23935 [Lentisphaerae bacterium GWF2_49_21]HBC88914.1 hypothetical protein [Lentisphaeria bacterium]
MIYKLLSAISCSFLLISICCQSAPIPPGPYDTQRAKTGTIVKCSPDGKAEGSLLPGEAIRNLKKGSILHLCPGNYSSSFDIDMDNLIIEGETGKYCSASIRLKGKKNIIRNLWTSSVECETDITVIDSVIGHYSCENNDKKMTQEFYNSCFNTIDVYSYKDNKLTFLKCNIVSDNSYAFWISWGDGNLYFTNCILYGKNKLFNLPERDKGNDQGIRISLDNTLLYGEMALADGISKGGVNSSGKEEKALDLKGLKRLSKQLTTRGDIINERPIFKKELQTRFAVPDGVRVIHSSSSSYYTDLNVFVLDDKSPGKDKNIGANLNEMGFPVPEQPKDPKKTAATPPAPAPTPAAPAPAVKPPVGEKPAVKEKAGETNQKNPELPAPVGPKLF